VKELARLHPVAKSDVQKTLNVTPQTAEEVLKAVGETLDLSGLGKQSQNDTLANQKLIPNLVLRERDVRRSHSRIERVKCVWAAPSGTEGMPLGRQTSAANVDGPLVENKAVRVAQNAQEVGWELPQDFNILDALASPSDARNVHRALWRTLHSTGPAPLA
jgi:hypothetical protein